MKKVHKFPVDLTAEDYAILTRLRDHLGIPAATILRWALRQYALVGPWTDGLDGDRERVLDGLGRMMIGPGVYETAPCQTAEPTATTPPPQHRRRRKSTG